ncbi:MAG: PQQ-binding-like beta-propeller repeat protein [Rubripirellula sp.]
MRRSLLILSLTTLAIVCPAAAQDTNPPTQWSATTGQNVLWQTDLAEAGQSGIAVAGGKLFLTINHPLPVGTTPEEAKGSDLLGLCFDAETGQQLWQVDLPGKKVMPFAGLFSDNTSPTPVSDGEHVWFINAGGRIACFTVDGESIWEREFETRTRHNAKNCQPILHGDWLLYVAMRDASDPLRRPMRSKLGDRKSDPSNWPWTFVRAFNKLTGEPAWVAEDGTSIHNTPTVATIGGKSFLFHGRGGGHQPPERPYGFSLTSLDAADAGKTVWRSDLKSGMAFFVSRFDDRFAYCFDAGRLVLLNMKDGSTAKNIPLMEECDVYRWDVSSGQYAHETSLDAALEGAKKPRAYPTNQSNIIVGDHCLFMSHEGHLIGRVNVISGKVEYLQVPVQVTRTNGSVERKWDKHLPADTQNSRGMEVAADRRAKGDGWGHVTVGSPIAVGDMVFFSTMLGTVYAIDSSAETFDESALLSINDSGPAGKTWTLSPLSHHNARFYCRTLKQLICIGDSESSP